METFANKIEETMTQTANHRWDKLMKLEVAKEINVPFYSNEVWIYELLEEIVTEVMNEILMNFMHNSTISKRMIDNLAER